MYFMYHLIIFFWVDSLLGYMGSRDHLFVIFVFVGVLRIKLTYLLTYYDFLYVFPVNFSQNRLRLYKTAS